MSNDPVRQVLLDAADLLERDGWCQHISLDFEGRHCAWGAMVASAKDSVSYSVAADNVEAAVGRVLTAWNDDKRRTAKSVIRKLREVANA